MFKLRLYKLLNYLCRVTWRIARRLSDAGFYSAGFYLVRRVDRLGRCIDRGLDRLEKVAINVVFGLEKYKALQNKADEQNLTPKEFILQAVQKAMDADIITSDLIDYHRRIVEA